MRATRKIQAVDPGFLPSLHACIGENYGQILAAQYQGRENFDAVYFVPQNNKPGYYNLAGKPVEKFFLK